VAPLRLHPGHDPRQGSAGRDAPAGAQLRRPARREPARIDTGRNVRDAAGIEPLLEQRRPVAGAVNDHPVRPAQRPEPLPQGPGAHVEPALRGADHAQVRIARAARGPERERVVVRKGGVQQVVSAAPRERGQQPSVVHQVPQAHLAGEPQPGLAGHSCQGEVLAQVFAGAHRIACESSVEPLRPKLPSERDQAFGRPRPGRAGDHQERRARPAHAESSGRRPAESKGESAPQAALR